jgi:small subunit ribosomal protein S6
MRNYEVTFIVDPVLSGDEIKTTAQTYLDMLANEGCTIVYTDEMGLRQLAYPINKRSSGVYFCIEFQSVDGTVIDKLELALRRDERIMRFLTAALDKFGVKYNADKREGKIGASKKRIKPITTLEPIAPPAPVTPHESSTFVPKVKEEAAVETTVSDVSVPEATVVEDVSAQTETVETTSSTEE